MGTTGQSITLANSIIGVGILAMPFCFQQCGILLASVILLLMGLVSRLCCHFLLKSALLARRRNFEFLAFHVFGSAGKLAVEVGIIGFLMGTCIAYFVVVGDLGPQIISKMFNINQSDMLRTSIMVIVSLVCVLPLGLLRNVDSLSNVSAATIGFYFCLVMKVIAEATSQLLVSSNWESRVEMWKPSGVLQCVPIFSMALFCQTQLFEIFESMPTLSLEKMNVVTKNAINICTAVYFTLGLFGYIAFSAHTISGNILMSLSPTMTSDVIKLGFVMSVAFSFPLIIFPCRASLYSLLYKKVHSSHHDHIINHSIPERSFRCITVCIVSGALGVSLLLPNIELVLGLVGSTIGVLVCVVFPAACFLHVTFKDTNERVLAKIILVLGLIIMILGTYANLQAAENQVDKYDDKSITKERIDKMVEDFFQKMEKSDGVMAKPEVLASAKIDVKTNGEIIKESAVQPPNPVPPESQSIEKLNKIDIPKLKEVIPKANPKAIDKVSETHPKNLNKLNDAKLSNGVNKEKKQDKDNVIEDTKPDSTEDKINLIKQQQLIETIKQHGEEQKELIKEQKEILDEIKKTKQELQKNKKEAVNDEAKKIAVESIKKIADLAIHSLAGVSDKPAIGDTLIDNKVADEAVQEIAQKAAETIEAIKEIAEKPEAIQPALPKAPVAPNPSPVQNGVPINNPPQVIAQNNLNVIQNTNNANSQSVPNNLPNLQNQQINAQPVNNQLSNMPQSNQGASNGQQNQYAANVAQSSPNVAQAPSNVQAPINVAQPSNIQPASNVQHPVYKDQPAINNVQPSVNNIQSQVNNVQSQFNNVQPQENNVQSQVNNVQPQVNNVQSQVNNVQPQLNNVQSQVNNVQSQVNNVQSQVNNVQPQVNNVQSQVNNVQPKVNNVQSHDHNVQPQVNNVQSQDHNVQPQVNNVQPQVNNVEPQVNNVPPMVNNGQPIANVKREVNNVATNNVQSQPNIIQPTNNMQASANNVQSAVNNIKIEPNDMQPAGIAQNSNIHQSNEDGNANNVNNKPDPSVQNQPIPQNDVKLAKQHSHSPDEPQSYKIGEDAQIKVNSIDKGHNVPLPLVIGKQTLQAQSNGDTAKLDNVQNNIDSSKDIYNEPVRQKREVVDCTEKINLQPADREICKLIDNQVKIPIINDEVDILSNKVDLGEGLTNGLPNALHHIRSLKSVDPFDDTS